MARRGTAWLVVAASLLVLVAQLTTDFGGRAELYGGDDIDSAGDVGGASTAVDSEEHKIMSSGQMLSQHARCTGLVNCVGQAITNKWLNKQGSPWQDTTDDSGCPGCSDDDDGGIPDAPAAGDVSISAVVTSLQRKLAIMKQEFRVVREKFNHGPARDISIVINPRGPRGFTGPQGTTGPPGLNGPKGGKGAPGPKGHTGSIGRRGVRGRTGEKGMTGDKGKPGVPGDTGPTGPQGATGYPGPPGGRGLPGAAGSAGANGKQGIPGPAGLDSGEGGPGPMGPRGEPGLQGKNGDNGAVGPAGPPGTDGNAGQAGAMGDLGPKGAAGVGPPPAVAYQQLGAWPKGGAWTSDAQCKKLNIVNNLGGLCEPLCEREGCNNVDIGFKIVNNKGIRYKGYSFDDNNIDAGSAQPRNICALARYGEDKTIEKVASDASYGKGDKSVEQPHWYGNCNVGDNAKRECCSNAMLYQNTKMDWQSFAHGNQCTGDSDKDAVITEIVCIYDKEKFKVLNKPMVPDSKLIKGKSLSSEADKDWDKYLWSPNKKYYFQINPTSGEPEIRKRADKQRTWRSDLDSSRGSGPYKLKFVGGGKCVIVNKDGSIIWSRGQNAASIELTDDGVLKIFSKYDSAESRNLLWDSAGVSKRNKGSAEDRENAKKTEETAKEKADALGGKCKDQRRKVCKNLVRPQTEISKYSKKYCKYTTQYGCIPKDCRYNSQDCIHRRGAWAGKDPSAS